jgi:hypothetical protein
MNLFVARILKLQILMNLTTDSVTPAIFRSELMHVFLHLP